MKDINKLMLKPEQVLYECEKCYAHISEDRLQKETLQAHTELSQKYWIRLFLQKNLADVIEEFERVYLEHISDEGREIFEKMTVNIVTFHDAGKENPLFQKKKMGHIFHDSCEPNQNIGSKHSVLSSIMYLDYFLGYIAGLNDKDEQDKLKDLLYMYSYIISRHHGNMNDLKTYLEDLTGKNTQSENLGLYAREWFRKWKKEVLQQGEPSKMIKKHEQMMARIMKKETEQGIYLYGFIRFLYSLLVASDYYATSEFMKGQEINDFGEIKHKEIIMQTYENSDIQKHIRTYEKSYYPMNRKELEREKNINVLRTELFLDAEKELKKAIWNHIFYLEAPTGSGKSNTAMNLSFNIMKEDSKIQKILYIYPFNTLVEQNMECISKIFEKKKEVMSQVAVVNSMTALKEREDEDEWSESNTAKKYQTILLDRQFLNYPLILSTHVMLFRTLFGHKKEDVFAFHQISHSVIILDEIQSYRNELWSEIILFLKSFSKLFHLKIIIMSATLPNLEVLTNEPKDTLLLIKDREKYFHHPLFLNRVIPHYELLDQDINFEFLRHHIKENRCPGDKILIEFISKKSAESFYWMMKEDDKYQVFVITGDSSIQERKNIIERVKNSAHAILIATQVIEAGVDIDMDIGYKDISILDSEEQFMGRINRSGKRIGNVYFFKLDDAACIYKNDIRVQKKVTLEVPEMREILKTKDFSFYYEQKILPDIKKKNGTFTKDNLQKFFDEKVKKLNMPEVDLRMQLINGNEKMINLYLARELKGSNGEIWNGREIWEEYRRILNSENMKYDEKTVKLMNIRTKMSYFIYQFRTYNGVHFQEDEQIGDIYYIENGEEYFDENGVLNRAYFQDSTDLFL